MGIQGVGVGGMLHRDVKGKGDQEVEWEECPLGGQV